jgi:hypothetical protein
LVRTLVVRRQRCRPAAGGVDRRPRWQGAAGSRGAARAAAYAGEQEPASLVTPAAIASWTNRLDEKRGCLARRSALGFVTKPRGSAYMNTNTTTASTAADSASTMATIDSPLTFRIRAPAELRSRVPLGPRNATNTCAAKTIAMT